MEKGSVSQSRPGVHVRIIEFHDEESVFPLDRWSPPSPDTSKRCSLQWAWATSCISPTSYIGRVVAYRLFSQAKDEWRLRRECILYARVRTEALDRVEKRMIQRTSASDGMYLFLPHANLLGHLLVLLKYSAIFWFFTAASN